MAGAAANSSQTGVHVSVYALIVGNAGPWIYVGRMGQKQAEVKRLIDGIVEIETRCGQLIQMDAEGRAIIPDTDWLRVRHSCSKQPICIIHGVM